jgi:transposase
VRRGRRDARRRTRLSSAKAETTSCGGATSPPCTTRRVRAYRERLAQVTDERHATVEVRGDEEALEATGRRWGGRMDGTKQPQEQLLLAPAVLAYRHAYLVERSCGRLKGCPRSLSPMDVPRDEHATGLRRLLSLGVRVLTLLECVARRQLTAAGAKLAGLSAGNANRETARPTAARLREAFQGVPLTLVERGDQTYRHVTALSPLQERILEILGCSSQVYTRLCTVSDEPP